MSCYCTTISTLTATKTSLENIKTELTDIYDKFKPLFDNNKTNLKDFFNQCNPYQFLVTNASNMTANIDNYENTLPGDFNAMIGEVESALTSTKSNIEYYTSMDTAHHAAEEARRLATQQQNSKK